MSISNEGLLWHTRRKKYLVSIKTEQNLVQFSIIKSIILLAMLVEINTIHCRPLDFTSKLYDYRNFDFDIYKVK